MYFKTCASVLIWTLVAATSHAQDDDIAIIETVGKFSLLDTQPHSILFAGDIANGDRLDFRRILRDNPDVSEIILTSPGGLVYEGIELASIINDRRLNTIVHPNGDCASACSFMFFAGHNRFALGDQLGVHQFNNEAGFGEIEDIQLTAGEIVAHLNDFDTPPFVLEKTLITPSADMYYFDSDEMEAINKTTPALFDLALQLADKVIDIPDAVTTAAGQNSPPLEPNREKGKPILPEPARTANLPSPDATPPNLPRDIGDFSYNTLRQIQFAMVLKGTYNGIIDGEWGAGSNNALKTATRSADPTPEQAFELAQFAKREAQRDGWHYYTSDLGMSFLLPAKRMRAVYDHDSDNGWEGYNGLLTVYFDETYDAQEALITHDVVRDLATSGANAYTVEKHNRIVSSFAVSDGWIYARTEAIGGGFATIVIIASDALPNGIWQSISSSYDKRGYSFDIANW